VRDLKYTSLMQCVIITSLLIVVMAADEHVPGIPYYLNQESGDPWSSIHDYEHCNIYGPFLNGETSVSIENI